MMHITGDASHGQESSTSSTKLPYSFHIRPPTKDTQAPGLRSIGQNGHADAAPCPTRLPETLAFDQLDEPPSSLHM